MKFYLISDNIDTIIGMRLAGIQGSIARDSQEAKQALNECIENEEIAMVLLTERLAPLCEDILYDIKMNRTRPLIVEIPDRHGAGRSKDSISKYVREAIGIKI